MKPLILSLFALCLTVNGCLRISWPEKCSPTDKAILLYAYSNDLEFKEVTDIYARVYGPIFWGDKTQYETAATVRFDTVVKEDIMFHDNDTVFWSHQKAFYHLQDQKVDPSLRINNSETGSDVLDMLENFVDSNHTNLCGSVAVVLMKRHPKETEISKLVRKLRELRIVLRILVQEPPSGGLHPETLYDLAAKTNVFCTFVNYSTWEDNQATVPSVFKPYAYYSLNLKVSGIGSMILPSITLTESVPMYLGISVQSTANAVSFQNLTISWYNTQSGTSGSFNRTREQLSSKFYREDLQYSELTSMNTIQLWDFLDEEATTYELTLDYNYSMEDNILIRMNSKQPIDHWLPYQDN
ncbi:hypothetical protein B9Z55_003209 [Caenorhabditis nigoni]|uniref:DUF7154 domain-containing protein n=1 Tax=Caenorhabditis nigoni TaxID=1611254 RepID=A0A2G5VPG4_9PELO|nr:hypothetical protein B9Z55_003209 [Caenorhabditis nigoni]